MTDEKEIPNSVRDAAYQRFCEAMGESSDPLMLVLRAHLYAENALEHILMLALPRGYRIAESAGFSFAQKLAVVDAVGSLPDEFISSLRQLNRVRNACAHQLEKAITMDDVTRIGSPFGAEFTRMRKEAKHDPRETLSMILSYLCGYIDAAREGDSSDGNAT